jgi:adenylosuccinate lyase
LLVLFALVGGGVWREEAYRGVQGCALGGGVFLACLAADADVTRKISREEIANLFDMSHHLRHIDALFTRALEDEDGAARASL